MTKPCENKTLVFIARIFIAGIFIWFSMDKLINLREFVGDIGNYGVVPLNLLNLTAIFLPAVELTAGIFLLIGLFTRASSLILTIFMLVFLLAYFYTKVVGIELFDCGCGGIYIDPAPGFIIIRDLIFLFAAILAYRGKHIFALENKIFNN